MKKVRVAIIDDSIVFRTFLRQILMQGRDIEVVGVFADPVEAMDEIPKIRPDVIAVDMEMPKLRGDEFLKAVLPKNPNVRAIVISAASGSVFDAMRAGAVDFVGKPNSQPGYANDDFRDDIIGKVMAAASAKSPFPAQPPVPAQKPAAGSPAAGLLKVTDKNIVAIGGSTGGTEAIIQVIREFPADMPGTLVVIHMPPGFTNMYAARADRSCQMSVREAKNRDRIRRGQILVAPGGNEQMRVVADGGGYYVELAEAPKVSGHCPSVDVLFESVAEAAGKNAVGVILTGMGADGAKNLKKMRDSGAHTIGQDEESCVVYGMPKVAYDIGGVSEQLPLKSIGAAVVRRFT